MELLFCVKLLSFLALGLGLDRRVAEQQLVANGSAAAAAVQR